jgi:pimeloyl-ACP methyl ester carboxylesterase
MFERFSCYTLDLPGMGEEPPTNCSLGNIDRIAQEIERLRIAAGVRRWSLVGHDAGSAIAVVYAHLFPESVNRLALISPVLFPDIRPYFLFQFLRMPILGEFVAPCIHPLIWRIAMPRACEGPDCEDSRAALTAFEGPFRGVLGPWRMMRLLRWGRPAEVLGGMPALLTKLQVPTVVLHGAKDPAIPVSFAYRTAGLIANSQLMVVDGGHFIPLNCPEIIAHGLCSFLGTEIGVSSLLGGDFVSPHPFFSPAVI